MLMGEILNGVFVQHKRPQISRRETAPHSLMVSNRLATTTLIQTGTTSSEHNDGEQFLGANARLKIREKWVIPFL